MTYGCIVFGQIVICTLFCTLIVVWHQNSEHLKMGQIKHVRLDVLLNSYMPGRDSIPLCWHNVQWSFQLSLLTKPKAGSGVNQVHFLHAHSTPGTTPAILPTVSSLLASASSEGRSTHGLHELIIGIRKEEWSGIEGKTVAYSQGRQFQPQPDRQPQNLTVAPLCASSQP